MNTLELAKMEDVEIYSEIINGAKLFQREQGFVQWTEDYPNVDTIREDIQKNRGYVFNVDDNIAGYLCIDFEGDSAYASIDGEWRNQEPYAVVHRMAISKEFRGIGLASSIFRLIEEICIQNNITNIRIDTDFPNKRMQHVLKKNGFEKCGEVVVRGSGRLAYDKLL